MFIKIIPHLLHNRLIMLWKKEILEFFLDIIGLWIFMHLPETFSVKVPQWNCELTY